MSLISLDTYSKETLSQALRLLRNYKNAYNQIGKRAHFSPSQKTKKILRIQHTKDTKKEDLESFVNSSISHFFPEMQEATKVYEINPDLVGGVRIFYDDDMIDVSFSKYSHLISF
ncbi:hypothetical protein CSB09_04785 [Candidatus Gracilibacteria bacterium]|nr:MAG: hypothetical protein CSB09_04785 [Candidatus Gracilibacteria bacterium]